ncbi:MAG: tail fiber domain-containing protein [Desulfobacula sp.]|jgi:hypothetical protein
MLRSVQKVFPLVLLVVLFFLTSDGVCEDGLVVGASGNVGIGTTTPTSKLQLAGTSYSNPSLTNGTPTMASFQSGSGTDFVIGSMQSSPYSAWMQHRHASYSGSSFPISLQPSGGNVGIGTTDPSYKLDVNGDIRGNNVSPSDIRWKTNINTIDNSLEKVSQLRGVTYEWTDPSKGGGQQIGVIAQEVEQVFPEVISTDNQGYKSVEYSKLIAPLIEAVKILKSENEKLRQDNEEIKKQITVLKAACTKLK